MDTGSPVTLLDRSLEKMLGKRLGTNTVNSLFGGALGAVYAAPALYLNDTKLETGPYVCTVSMNSTVDSGLRGRAVMGILGVDCLRHWCVRFDFIAKRLDFLDPNSPEEPDWGRAYSLSRQRWSFPFSRWRDGRLAVRETFAGNQGISLEIDTGYSGAGVLKAGPFRNARRATKELWTNADKIPKGGPGLAATFQSLEFGGQSYSNLTIVKGRANLIGLDFLARHQVTINFPKKRMYLQPITVESPADSFPNHFATTLGWWEMEGAAPHFSKETLAACIVSPPNLHPADSVVFWWRLYTPKVISSIASINRPDARIRMIDLPAGNYHVVTHFKVTTNAAGERYPTMNCGPENSDPMVPMHERGTVFILHDYDTQKEWMFPWAFLFAQAGYRAILVDLRGHGESTGRDVSYGKYEVADLTAVLDGITGVENHDGKVGVFGVGYGANVALSWAARDSRVGAIVAIAPYDDPEQAFQGMADEQDVAISDDLLHESLQIVAAKLGINWPDWSGAAAIRQLKEPVLLISGGHDSVSPPRDIKRMQSAAFSGSKMLSIPDATHDDVWYRIDKIAEPAKQWFAKHLQAGRKN